MIETSDQLLFEASVNDLQRKFLHGIFTGSTELRDLFLSFPMIDIGNAAEVFSFETRSHLANIIGYSEVLLEEEEGELNAIQRERVHEIRSAGKQLLARINNMIQ